MIWATVLIAGLLVVGGALQIHLSRALWKAVHDHLGPDQRLADRRQVLLRAATTFVALAVLTVAYVLGARHSVRAGAGFAVVAYIVMGLSFVIGLLIVARRRTVRGGHQVIPPPAPHSRPPTG